MSPLTSAAMRTASTCAAVPLSAKGVANAAAALANSRPKTSTRLGRSSGRPTRRQYSAGLAPKVAVASANVASSIRTGATSSRAASGAWKQT